MQKITSAYANKMLRSLEEDKAFWVNKESTSSTYVPLNGNIHHLFKPGKTVLSAARPETSSFRLK